MTNPHLKGVNKMSFGRVIAEARKKAGRSQKELAASLTKEDGTPISPQYLNDIEHDRRNPPSESLLKQIANELSLSLEYLLFLAGQIPEDIRKLDSQPKEVEAAFKAFRRQLKGK
jgi:transcriptional regulator with XRE-family HTH domain